VLHKVRLLQAAEVPALARHVALDLRSRLRGH
jgi:hypothetical protein